MKRLGTLGLLMMALLALAGCGASPASQLAEGNEAYTAGDYDTAVQNYRAAQAIDPDAPEPIFNIANALYRQGLPSEAQKLLELAQDVLPEEAQALAQNIWFNLGNARYEAGQATAAVEAYKQALRLDPTDQDAKYNLELALLQENQQEQEQEQQEQEQQEQQEQDDSSDEQEQEQEQQESGSEQSDQNEGDPSDQTGENGEQNEQNEQNEENGQSEDQPSEPEDGQGEAGEPQEPESDGEQAAQPNAGQGEPTDETGQSYTIPEQLEGLTPEQAEQLLGAVGENTQTLQERLQQIFVVPGGPGDKDW